MKIKYVEKRFGVPARKMIEQANQIIEEYQAQGYELTLRQLYYQFVSRDLLANKQKEYKKLGSVINDARLAGLVSWEAIVDRTRNLVKNPHWLNPKQFMESVTPQFGIDKWENQRKRVEVWIEKDALVGVIEKVCRRNDVSFFSCRGYTSQSEMWAAARRLQDFADELNQEPVIIHLGDHDPSGMDMSRDIFDRLDLFTDGGVEVERIALNMDQIQKYDPPPNPAKLTDSRATGYVNKFGNESWELDALEPSVLDALIEKTILSYRDDDAWEERIAFENGQRKALVDVTRKMKDFSYE